MNSQPNVPIDRSQRSIFVGNVPYDATEEQLKDIFSEVGPVLSFRLVYDRETGKPKGFGFCEFKDQETAMSAIRNLNNIEYNGRSLKVDSASNEKNEKNFQYNKGNVYNISGHPQSVEENKVAENAPEAITKAVASLPPEQMFELLKQMKALVKNNYYDARNMLVQNPQLAYALLQALIMLGILDSNEASKFLHPDRNFAQSNTLIQTTSLNINAPIAANQHILNSAPYNTPPAWPQANMTPQFNNQSIPIQANLSFQQPNFLPNPSTILQPPPFLLHNMNPPTPSGIQIQNMSPVLQDQDLRIKASSDNKVKKEETLSDSFPGFEVGSGDIDMRGMSSNKRGEKVGFDSLHSNGTKKPKIPSTNLPEIGSPNANMSPSSSSIGRQGSSNIKIDDEKSALIKQVLKLTDQQIALLPADQQKNILLLKQQFSKKN